MNQTKKPPAKNARGGKGEHASVGVSLSTIEKVMALKVAEAQERHERLTERQRQVAGWMARGLTNRQIADQLGISPKTLDIHRADVFDKLGVKTSAAVAAIVFLVTLADLAEPI
jgi:DNA-binding CsgD family transcriptional regulator